MPPPRRSTFARERGLRIVARPPGEHRVSEDVVEDLVAVAGGMAVSPERSQDAFVRERLENRLELTLSERRVAGEVGDPVRDLRTRGRDEMAEDIRCGVSLRRREGCQGSLEVALDDRLSPTEPAKGRQPQHPRAALALDLPDSLHHELEVRRLDALRGRWADALGRPPARERRLDPTRLDLGEHRVGERRLDRDGPVFTGQLVVTIQRPEDGRPGCLVIEVIESDRIREEPRDPRLEDVELGESVVPDAEQDVDSQPSAPDELGKKLDESPGTVVCRVIEEELLELIEQEAELGAELGRPAREPVDQVVGRLVRLTPEPRPDRVAGALLEAGKRVAGPGPVDGDGRRGRTRGTAQRTHDAGPQERALADAGRAVENRQARREDVRRHDLRLPGSAKEEEGVELGIVVDRKALVRAPRLCADRGDVHPTGAACSAAISCSRSADTASSSGASMSSTPRRRQKSCSKDVAPAWIAQER